MSDVDDVDVVCNRVVTVRPLVCVSITVVGKTALRWVSAKQCVVRGVVCVSA